MNNYSGNNSIPKSPLANIIPSEASINPSRCLRAGSFSIFGIIFMFSFFPNNSQHLKISFLSYENDRAMKSI